MLPDRYETDKLFDSILNLTNQMDQYWPRLISYWKMKALYQLIRNDFAKRYPQTEQAGRNSTPGEVILRSLVIKRLYR